MRHKSLLLSTVLVAALSGCSMDNQTPMAEDFGNAVRHNIRAQTIDPEPAHATAGAPALDGHIAGGAYTRYATDKVKQPRPEKTSGGSGGSGGGSGN
jgi:hypothetical protein